jgi:predicted esterase
MDYTRQSNNRQEVQMFQCLTIGWILFGLCAGLFAQDLDEAIAKRVETAGENRDGLELALASVPEDQRDSLRFLVAFLPDADAQTLTAEQLLENVRLAHEVRSRLPWQQQVPDDIFLNHVLPHACLDETRDPWRAGFLEKYWPLVAETKSASEAAQILNREVFALLNVKYSTARQRPNQSPAESIAQGLASCSGLSIILVDACRAVGVPARVAGIPSWTNKRGNHTWVEVWDHGWHFTGAAEFDPAGLDRAWFTADAALADPDSPRHSIYATTWQPTGIHFPLVWDRSNRSIHAENVTARYLFQEPETETGTVRALFQAVGPDGKQRVRSDVTIEADTRPSATADGALVDQTSPPPEAFTGSTRDESSDRNDVLEFGLQPDRRYWLTTTQADGSGRRFLFRTTAEPQQSFEWRVVQPVRKLPATANPDRFDANTVREFAKQWFTVEPEARSALEASPIGKSWPGDSLELRTLLWETLKESGRLDGLRDDLAVNRIASGEHVSPFTIKDVGERPPSGWPLVIAMHGGGNAPQELNDSQWEHMQIYYKDHPEFSGYRYLALRAPNNSWNGFYDNYVYPLIMDLIAQQVAWNDVDPNRIYLIGYSHGGYGAFAIGPKLPDLFAAIHASASAGTDGESVATGLHTTRFTWMVGGRDTAFGRRERCESFARTMRELRGPRLDRYPAEFFLKEGNGHGGLPDRDWLVEMLPFERENSPLEVDWELTDPVVRDHYWLHVDDPGKGQKVSARILGDNRIEVTTTGRDRVELWLDDRLIDTSRPVQIMFNGQPLEITPQPGITTLCTTLLARRDIHRAATVRVELGKSPGK